MNYPYVQALQTSLPQEYSVQVDAFCQSASGSALLENLIRFIAGAEPPAGVAERAHHEWIAQQSVAKKAFDALASLGRKRAREDENVGYENGAKRQKIPDPPSGDTESDPPIFCLHSVSATSPVRKKVDITVHRSSVRFTHPSSHAVEASISLSSLRRAFLVPTRGKQKPHWTVILLSSDAPERGKPSVSAAQANPQIIFGLDATAPSPMTTATYLSSLEPTKNTLAKGAETLPSIRTFLSHIGSTVLRPTPDVFRSACAGTSNTSASSGGVPGIETYRAAKPGTLWFLKEGLLWGENKPCEFWAVEDLMSKTEGLRMLSATGRTCSIILTRKGAEANKGDESSEDVGIETEFAMVDGKEQEGINQWVRQHRHSFGKKVVQNGEASGSGNAPTIKTGELGDESDSSDETFDADSDSDSGSTTSSNSSDEENASDGGGSGAESKEGEETSEEEESEDEDLRPEHHPLMRPGAMPKMSRAAIDAVVGMVNEDLMGGSDGEDELMDD